MKNDISLFINTATKSLEFGIYDNSFHVVNLGDSKKALENSFVGINKLLEETSLKFASINTFYTLLGPGSNTGIRLGLTIVRSVYGINPNIKMYGINTLKVLLSNKNNVSILSDRAGNLFVGYYQNDEFKTEKVLKSEISNNQLFKERSIDIDKYDKTSLELFSDFKNKNEVSVIQMMFDKRDEFDSYSSKIDEYLPIYQFEI